MRKAAYSALSHQLRVHRRSDDAYLQRRTAALRLRAALIGRLGRKVALCAIAFCLTTVILAGQQPTSKDVNAAIKGNPPGVAMDARGCPVLKLTDQQRAAVAKFEQAHPLVAMYNYAPSDYSNGSCLDVYQQWRMSFSEGKVIAQYPFAVWGDFNRDGFLDFTVFFVSKKPVHTQKWPMNGKFVYTYEYEWWVVVFQGSQDGGFAPVIAGKDRWARALDGVVFDLGRRRIEYWLKTAGGSVQWTGAGYRMTPMKSND